jgi:hypothetical protein
VSPGTSRSWDAERVRLDERRRVAQGMRRYTVGARSQATGELAGLTALPSFQVGVADVLADSGQTTAAG